MQFKISFVLLSQLTISLAANVTVYYGNPYSKVSADPREVSQLPWEFGFAPGDSFYIAVSIKNKSPGVTWYNLTCSKGHGKIVAPAIRSEDGLEDLFEFVDATEIEIKLNLYSSGVVCSSLLVAKGRTDWPADKKPFDVKICKAFCIVKVDISDQCVDKFVYEHTQPLRDHSHGGDNVTDPLDTESNTTTTLKPFVKNVTGNNLTDYVPTSPHDIIETTTIKVTTNGPPLDTESNTTTTLKPVEKNVTGNNLTDYVPTSPHDIIETTTIKVTTNETDATDSPAVNTTIDSSTIITIISSIFGVVQLILVVICFLMWTKRNRAGTNLALSATVHRFEPFYPNMLFRRECDREIAEIEQHVYEEVGPPIYDVIAPSICSYEEIDLRGAGSRVQGGAPPWRERKSI